MPRRKKAPVEMTSEEALRRLFPPKVVLEAHKQAHVEPKSQVREPKGAIKKKGT